MAVYKLGDPSWKNYIYTEKLWGKDIIPAVLLPELYPPVTKITSLSENRDFCWLFGKFLVGKGKGSLQVMYPEISESRSTELHVRNYDLSAFPFVKIVATPATGFKFTGWKRNKAKEYLQTDPILILESGIYQDVTEFVADFEKNA